MATSRKKVPPPDSPVMTFLGQVWSRTNTARDHSWERLNHAMHAGLLLAIEAGFPFDAGDFRALNRFNPVRWMGESWEWAYSAAVNSYNLSAAVAYETFAARQPIIADDVTPSGIGHRMTHGGGADRAKERLHVGCRFPWKGFAVTVTSFNESGAAVAIVHHDQTDAERKKYAPKRIMRRFAIGRDMVIFDRDERKIRARRLAVITDAIVAGKINRAYVLRTFGVKAQWQLDRLDFTAFDLAADTIDAHLAKKEKK
jgi:hypothetical protein